MFRDFDQRFFNGTLVRNGVEVGWSSKMTLCAGLCRWRSNTLACEIKLSKPLLQLRSRKDLVETLIHEMIHALLFVTRDSDNRESHGPKFHQHMYRINRESSLSISVYHTFHDEVRHYQNHVWRCKGICRQRAPYYGWVRRSMNRKPGPSDTWWAQHQQSCGGEFEKVSEPLSFAKQKTKPAKENQPIANNTMSIRNFFSPTKATSATSQPSTSSPTKPVNNTTGSNYKANDIRNFFSPGKAAEAAGQSSATSPSNSMDNSTGSSYKVNDIRNFFSPTKAAGAADRPSASNRSDPISSPAVQVPRMVDFDLSSPDKSDLKLPANIVPFSGQGRVLGGASANDPHPSKSILLQKFDNTKKNASSSTATRSTSSSSIALSPVTSATATNSNHTRAVHSIILDDSMGARAAPGVRKLDESVDLVSPASKRKRLNETLTLSDEEDFSWLNDLKDDELLGNSKSSESCIVIDD